MHNEVVELRTKAGKQVSACRLAHRGKLITAGAKSGSVIRIREKLGNLVPWMHRKRENSSKDSYNTSISSFRQNIFWG